MILKRNWKNVLVFGALTAGLPTHAASQVKSLSFKFSDVIYANPLRQSWKSRSPAASSNAENVYTGPKKEIVVLLEGDLKTNAAEIFHVLTKDIKTPTRFFIVASQEGDRAAIKDRQWIYPSRAEIVIKRNLSDSRKREILSHADLIFMRSDEPLNAAMIKAHKLIIYLDQYSQSLLPRVNKLTYVQTGIVNRIPQYIGTEAADLLFDPDLQQLFTARQDNVVGSTTS